VGCYQERFRIYSELPSKLVWLFAERVAYDDKAAANLRKAPGTADWLEAWLRCLGDLRLPPSRPQRPAAADEVVRLPSKKDVPFPADAPWATPPQIEAASRQLSDSLGIGFGQLVHPIRAALTGTTEGASLFDVVYLLGREQVAARVQAAVAWLGR
jgi:glutamyl/glutaminyl-tRNA synthetase